MFDHEDLKWIATTSTDLNSMLQQISRYSDLARRHKGEQSYIDLLGERVELAAKTAQALFDRVTSTILEHSAATKTVRAASTNVPFKVLPPPLPHSDATLPSSKMTPRMEEAISKLSEVVSRITSATKTGPVEPLKDIPSDIIVKNPKGKRELLLLVEDEVQVAELAAEMLAFEGYKVIVVHDGFQALRIYERLGQKIALVILDFFLPIMDGDAVFEELRNLNPNINVVLSSGFAEQNKISSMLASGLRGFIPKPYTSERLLAQVRSTLDAGRQVAL
jgi:CheY-like chemotaxis protein